MLLRPSEHERTLFMRRLSSVAFNRNLIAQDALDWGADALLWIDSDQTFPTNALERVAGLHVDIVGCNYGTRTDPPSPTAHDLNGERVWPDEAAAKRGDIKEVGALGLGFCLIRRSVFESVERPWFIDAASRDGSRIITEDVHFMDRAREAGHKVHLDCFLSEHIGHVTERLLFLRDVRASSSPM